MNNQQSLVASNDLAEQTQHLCLVEVEGQTIPDLTNIEQYLMASNDLAEQTRHLCDIKIEGLADPRHLPSEIKKELEAYRSQMLYHLGEAQKLYLTKNQAIQQAMLEWSEATYYYSAENLIGSAEWHNYYPAITIQDKPYKDLWDAKPATEEEQRYLATQLITRALPKKHEERLLRKAQGLVNTLDPRDADFFPLETLNECLEREGLSSQRAINAMFGRKHYAPITKADKREALALVWEERNREGILKHRFLSGDWNEFEGQILQSFFMLLVMTIKNHSGCGYANDELELAIWSVLANAKAYDDDVSNYYEFLDPRDEETWGNIQNFVDALNKLDKDQLHYDDQDGKTTAQKWMKEVGLPALYGTTAEWWIELPDVAIERQDPRDGISLLGQSNLTPREKVNLAKCLFKDETEERWQRLVSQSFYNRLLGIFQ